MTSKERKILEDAGALFPAVITNADRIRRMTDEELANWYFSEFFPNAPYCNKLECYRDSPCEQCLLDWLKQEAEE